MECWCASTSLPAPWSRQTYPPVGVGSGDYAIRFASVGGSPWMSVPIPCASYALRVTIVGQAITPDPGTLESFVGACGFPWDEEQERMAMYLQDPLQFGQRETGIVLQNPEWGVAEPQHALEHDSGTGHRHHPSILLHVSRIGFPHRAFLRAGLTGMDRPRKRGDRDPEI